MSYYDPEHTQNLKDEELAAATQEQEDIYRGLARCLKAGLEPSAAAAQQWVERWRAQRERYYYECNPTLMQGFAAVFAVDGRWRQYFDAYAPGLAAYFSAAIAHYCAAFNK